MDVELSFTGLDVLWPLLVLLAIASLVVIAVKIWQTVILLRSIDRSLKTLPSVQQDRQLRRVGSR